MFPRLLSLALLTLLAVGAAAAADLETLPRILHHRIPTVSAEARRSGAEVDLWVEIDAQGRVINAAVQRATDPRLAVPCLRAIRRWRYAPATQDGSPVPTAFVQPLRFGADGIDTVTISSAPPTVRRRVTPEIPAGLGALDAEVTVALSVDPTGAVTDVTVVHSDANALNDATVDAALQWTFRPAVRDDVPVPSKVYVPFHYKGRSATAREARAISPASRGRIAN